MQTTPRNKWYKNHKKHPTGYFSGGFVLSFAVLVAGILLSIGLAIFTITLKELILSGSGRESQFAFYAADTGGECALYWDIKHAGFSGSVFGPII